MKITTITDELLAKYFDTTKRALDKIKIPETLSEEQKKQALDYQDMATRYFKDAHYFQEQGDFVRAYGAVNYAHAWLDAGARIGLFDVDGDNVLFTVDAKE